MQVYTTELCFFLISVSFKLAWTSISSLLSQYSRDYGPEVLLQLNMAYFFPSIPVLILQTLFNDSMDRRFGLPLAALMRFAAGLGGLSIIMSFFPMLAASHAGLLTTTVAVGMCYGLAFGTSYQLASKFSPGSTIALTTGFVSSGPIVLILDMLIKDGPFYSPEGLSKLYSWVAVITSCGLVAACWVIFSNMRMLRMGSRTQHVELRLPGGRGSTGQAAPSKKLLRRGSAEGHSQEGSHSSGPLSVSLESMESGEGISHGAAGYHSGSMRSGSQGHALQPVLGYDEHDDKQYKRDLPLMSLAWRVAPAALSIFLSVGSSMLVFPFFTYVHSTGLLGDRLAQVLFYVRLIGDVMGRIVPPRLQITTVHKLMLWGAAKTAMLPLLYVAIFYPHLCLGDLGAILLIGLFWVLSGYLNTCSYLLAPKLVPHSQRARASGIMTVGFQSSCFVGLIAASVVQHWVVLVK